MNYVATYIEPQLLQKHPLNLHVSCMNGFIHILIHVIIMHISFMSFDTITYISIHIGNSYIYC